MAAACRGASPRPRMRRRRWQNIGRSATSMSSPSRRGRNSAARCGPSLGHSGAFNRAQLGEWKRSGTGQALPAAGVAVKAFTWRIRDTRSGTGQALSDQNEAWLSAWPPVSRAERRCPRESVWCPFAVVAKPRHHLAASLSASHTRLLAAHNRQRVPGHGDEQQQDHAACDCR